MRHATLALLTALVVTLLPACYAWAPTDVSPRQLLPAEHPEALRLTLKDGSRVELAKPEIAGDSILGTAGQQHDHFMEIDSTVTKPLDDIVAVEVKRLNSVRTGVVVTVIAAAVAATLLATFSHKSHLIGCSPTGC